MCTATSAPAPFSLQPPPVELEGACFGKTGASERLGLAVRLARRDLLRSLLTRGTAPPPVPQVHMYKAQGSCLLLFCQYIYALQASVPAVTNQTTSSAVPAATTVCVGVGTTGAGPGQIGGSTKKGRESGSTGICENEPVEQVRNGRVEREGESSELVCLKKALSREVQRLQELCAREGTGEDEEEEERERQRTAEQVSVMARKLYDLQRQVRDGWVASSENSKQRGVVLLYECLQFALPVACVCCCSCWVFAGVNGSSEGWPGDH